MSVSSLPEWKQLLLEKKRREEEERERREKEEEEKLSCMPAWKRGIIQRRRAKHEGLGDREKEKDVSLLQEDVRSSDGLSDTDSSVTVNVGSEPSLSPDPGQWPDTNSKSLSQVSLEAIVPVHENPFIRTQSAWKKGRDADAENEPEVNEKEKDRSSPRGQDGEPERGRDIELKIERVQDLNEEWEKERSEERSQGRENENSRVGCDKDNQWKDSVNDAMKGKEFLKVRKHKEEKDTDPQSSSFSSLVPCLRAFRADNIIIIERERKGSKEKSGRWREVESEKPEEDQGKRGMKIDLREILAGGGSVTEIHAPAVLIIKPPASPEGRTTQGKGREDGEMKCCMDIQKEVMAWELRTDMSWLREKEKKTVKEKERTWGQATFIKEDRKDTLDDNVFVERGGRVSQLLSKFGEHPKPPSRSKSSDNFLQRGRRKYSGDQDDQQSEERKAAGRNMLLKGMPKRSFSFSDRVICAKKNGLDDEGCSERKTLERVYSDNSVALWVDIAGLEKENTAKIQLGCTQLLDKHRFEKHRDLHVVNQDGKGGPVQRGSESEMFISVQHRSNVKKAEPVDKRDVEKSGDTDRDEGFMVTSVTNTEVISFARRVPIRQDRKARAEREVKRWAGEKSLERGVSVEKDCESREQIEAQFGDKKAPDLCQEKGFESLIPAETRQNCVMTTRADAASPCHTAESQYKHEPAFTGLLCAVTLRAGDPHSRPEWSSTGPYLTHTALSHHTGDLMSKTEKTEDTTVNSNEKEEKAYKTVGEMTNECKQEGHYSNISSECIIHDETARCPKEITPVGNPPGPLEIQIPRTVFYIAEEMVERKKTLCQNIDGKNWEGMQGVEKRDRWRIGKPLSCIESLREKIRQRELESLRQRETQDSDGSEAADISDTQTDLDMYDKRGTEIEKEWEAAAHMQKRLVEVETGQEDAAAQISMAAFDVTQEVSVLKTCPQLPVSVLHSQAVRREEVIRRYTAAACEVVSDSSQIPEHEDDPPKHVEEQLTCHRGRHEGIEEREEDKKELSVEEVGEDTSPLDPTQSLSSSPVHPNSLAAMSRIYNLETVGSRSGLCLRERTVDVSSVHLVKVKPLISNAQQGDSKAFTGEDKRGVQSIQRQIEQFQLKEKEALKSCSSPKSFLKDRETKGQQSPRGVSRHQVKDDVKTQEKAQEKAEINLNMSPQHVCASTSPLKQTITINPSRLRSPSPDSSLKPSDCAPTPASSPSSASPVQSPSVSPFPTPSPTLFSIRSASGGQVKRGATITITPRKPTAGGGGDATGSSTGSTAAGLAPAKAPLQQAQMTPTETEPAKKKYPTVDEIKVIGGYQNLEKSCLVKNRGTPKRVKVCFVEDQLEQVCEYPSEASMLASTPYPHDLGRIERLQGKEEQEEDDEVEEAAIVSKGTRNVAIAVRRGLRVDESCLRSSPKLPM